MAVVLFIGGFIFIVCFIHLGTEEPSWWLAGWFIGWSVITLTITIVLLIKKMLSEGGRGRA